MFSPLTVFGKISGEFLSDFQFLAVNFYRRSHRYSYIFFCNVFRGDDIW